MNTMNVPIIGKNGKAPSNVEQAEKAQMKLVEDKTKKIIGFAVEENFTANELFMCCDVIAKKINNVFQGKIDKLKTEFQGINTKETLLDDNK